MTQPRRLVDPATDAAILGLHHAGLSNPEIARRVGFSLPAVLRSLGRSGVAVGPRPWTADEEAAAVALHRSGLTGAEVAKRLGRGGGQTLAVLRRAGATAGRGAKRTYPLDAGYFAAIDSEPKAYWLGFLAADATVTDDGVILKVASRDRGHLGKFAAAVGYGGPVRDLTTEPRVIGGKPVGPRPMSVLAVHSRRLVANLAAHGVGPRKSATLAPWEGPDDLVRHWWRGLVDGDGGWWRTKQGTPVAMLSCSPAVADAYAAFVGRHTGYAVRVFDVGPVRDARVTNARVIQHLARVLYAGATVWLDRKKAFADEVLSETYRAQKMRRVYVPDRQTVP